MRYSAVYSVQYSPLFFSMLHFFSLLLLCLFFSPSPVPSQPGSSSFNLATFFSCLLSPLLSQPNLIPLSFSLPSPYPITVRSDSIFHPRRPFTPHFAPTSEFFDFTVSPTMGRDHLPDRYVLEISRVLAQWNT